MTDFASLATASVVAVAVLLLPGLPALALLGLRGLPLAALSGALSVAIVASTGVLAALVGIPFGPLPILALTVIVSLAALGLRRLGFAHARSTRVSAALTPAQVGQAPALRAVLTALAIVVSSIAIAFVAMGSVADAGAVSQTYDGVFHLNASASILSTGDGSSFHLYRVSHPGEDTEFYPAAWHDLVAAVSLLTGVSVPIATNAVWIASSGALFVVGSAFLAGLLFPEARSRGVEAIAALLASAGALAPYLLLGWGTLYPTGLAYALMPAGLALVYALVTRGRDSATAGFDRISHRSEVLLIVGLLAVWLVAAAFAHPRSLPTFAVLIAPLLIGRVVRSVRMRWQRPEARRRIVVGAVAALVATAVIVVVGAIAVLTYFGAGARPISDRLNGGPATAHQSIGESILQILLLSPPAGADEATVAPAAALGALTLVGLVLSLLRPGRRWVAVGFLLLAALYVISASSNSDFAKIATGLWYKDKYRLLAGVGILVAPLAASAVCGIAAALSRYAKGRFAVLRLTAPALALIVAAISWWGPTLHDMTRYIGTAFAVPTASDGASLLDDDEVRLMKRLPELVPEGELVVGNPWNGSALAWAIGDRQTVFPAMTGDWGLDRYVLQNWLNVAELDPQVCAALDRLNAHYLFASDGLLWGGSPESAYFPGIDRAPDAPGFTAVATEGSSTLYRISACD